MAVVNPKNFFGLEMESFMKKMFIDKYVSEVPEKYRSLRKWYAEAYTSDTPNNYVISKHAQETVEQIKLDEPRNVVNMVIENADPDGATYLLNKFEFFRYFPIKDRGTDDMMCIWMKKELLKTTVMGEDFDDFYIRYESWRLSEGEIYHPVDDRLPVIVQFIKTMIFVKCSNVEAYEMKSGQKIRPPRMTDNKWINKSGTTVTLINADWNRMYIKTEGFSVRGHIRFQRHGKENKLIKIVYIDSYQKKGYKRKFHS
jgi:hypothetical protein